MLVKLFLLSKNSNSPVSKFIFLKLGFVLKKFLYFLKLFKLKLTLAFIKLIVLKLILFLCNKL